MITNPKNKMYIGQSSDCFRRWDGYRNLQCKSQPKLYRSLVKYGWENHTVKIIALGEPRYLDLMESLFITMHDSIANGLNLRTGGSRPVFSEESRLRMSASAKVKVFSPEHRESMRKAQLGRKHPEAVKEKIGAAQRGTLNHRFGSGRAVIQKDLQGNVIRRFTSTHHVARETNIPHQMIDACCRRNAGLLPSGMPPRTAPPRKRPGQYKSRGYMWFYD
jgi:group I intron endonuclease